MAGILDGKVALITGGTSGIGAATARLFAEEGARVLITGRDEEKGRAMVAELGAAVAFHRADVTRAADIEESVEKIVGHFGSIDILFNNAGGGTPGGLEDVTVEQFRYAMDLLVGSVLFGTKYAAPHMKARGWGRIINNSSIAAIRTHMGDYLYSAAKAAVSQATRLAGMELGRHGVTVNAVSPGAIATPIFYGGSAHGRTLRDEENERKMQKLKDNLAKANPLQRSGLPADIAHVALFLASEDSAFLNCQDIAIDGGMSAGGRDRF